MTTILYYAVIIIGAGTLSRWIIRLVDWVGGEKH